MEITYPIFYLTFLFLKKFGFKINHRIDRLDQCDGKKESSNEALVKFLHHSMIQADAKMSKKKFLKMLNNSMINQKTSQILYNTFASLSTQY